MINHVTINPLVFIGKFNLNSNIENVKLYL